MTADLSEVSQRIEQTLTELSESSVPALTERVEDLVRAMTTLYGAGLQRVLELGDDALTRRLADDQLVGSLLVVHDLHPDDVTTRVQRALDQVRPYLGSHAGGVEFLGVDDEGVAQLRLEGSCDGCPSSAATVTGAIENAILAAAPDIEAVEVEGMVAAEQPLLQIQPYAGPRVAGETDWSHLELDAPPNSVAAVQVAGEPLLVARLAQATVAYLDQCPSCKGSLSDGQLDGDLLTCRGCSTTYDVHLAGAAVSGAEVHLEPVPMLPDGDGWKVSVPARVGT